MAAFSFLASSEEGRGDERYTDKLLGFSSALFFTLSADLFFFAVLQF